MSNPPSSSAPSSASQGGSGASQRSRRRTLTGRVTSTKMKSTLTVLVERTFKHSKYGKYVRKNKAYHAHDPAGQARDGDLVEIAASRPISKLKRWRLVRVVDAAPERGAEIGAIEQAEAAELAGPEAGTAPEPGSGGGES